MICPNCSTANPENAKFCLNCGTRFPASCAGCGVALAPGAKFCHACGTPVGGSAPRPTTSRLNQFLPAEVAARLALDRPDGTTSGNSRGAPAIEAERRVVTVLFCDVKGSTALAEQLDPEEWTEIMNGAFECLIAPVTRYGGTVA